MIYRIAADALVVMHLGFVLFVVLGALLALRWRWVAALHVPAALWGAALELFAFGCPLTPLEKHFRRLGGEQGYEGGFIEHYLVAVLYPEGLDRVTQVALGVSVVLLNLVVYAWIVVRSPRPKRVRRPIDSP